MGLDYLLFLNLEEIYQFNNFYPSHYIHFFIPVFSTFYLLIHINNKFYLKYLFLFLLPIISFMPWNITRVSTRVLSGDTYRRQLPRYHRRNGLPVPPPRKPAVTLMSD